MDNSFRRIYWRCLEARESDEEFVERSLKQLEENLRNKPTEFVIECAKLEDKEAEKVIRDLTDPSVEFVDKVSDLSLYFLEQSDATRLPGLVVCCQRGSLIAQQARSTNPLAQWGGKLGRLALVWQPDNRHLIWHETLHLLGAEDCYDDETTEGTCEKEPQCIMQYAPTEESVALWPECLCVGTVSQGNRI